MSRIRLLLGINVFWLSLGMLSISLNMLVLPAYLLNFPGLQPSALDLIAFVGLIAGMLVQPLAGALSDQLRPRWGRMPALSIGVILTLCAMLSLASVRTADGLFLSYIMVQTAAAIAQAGQQALLPDLVPTEDRGVGAGLTSLMNIAGILLGFTLLGYILAHGGVYRALLVISISLLATLTVAMILLRDHLQWPAGRGRMGMWRAVWVALRLGSHDAYRLGDLGRHKGLLRLVISRFLFLLGAFTVGRFLLYFVADRLELAPARATEETNMLLAVLSLIAVIVSPVAGWAADRLGRLPVMMAGALVGAAGMLTLTIAHSAWHILAFGSLTACGTAAFISANLALTADIVPQGQAARFLALANWGTIGAAACAGLGSLLVNGINQIAPGVGSIVLLVISALSLLASTLPLRRVRILAAEGPSSPLR